MAIEGTLEEGAFATFQDRLRADPTLRREYLELVALDHLLVELYEVPAHISLHARALNEGWGSRRRRLWQALGSLAAAILLLLAGSMVFLAIRANQPEVRIAGSADSRFAIDGEVGTDLRWKVGQELEVRTGAVSLALNPSVEACLEAPAKVRLIDRAGRLELIEGKAFFQIIPGGRRPDFWVRTPVGIVRDIGTKFGLEVSAGVAEVHVRQGIVEIDREDGQPPYRVEAGGAAEWGKAGPIGTPVFSADKFLQSLPWDQVLFEDNFAGEEGSPVSGRQPPRGASWKVWQEEGPTLLGKGVLDTSDGARVVAAEFLREPDSHRNGTYVIRLRTATPASMDVLKEQPEARESITFRGREGEPVFRLLGHSATDHHWQLMGARDGEGGSQPTSISAFSDETITLHYEKRSGLVLMFRGSSSEGPLLARVRTLADVSLGGMRLENANGGDLALDHLSVRLVSYPRQRGAEE